jgi:hypothetical protein
MDAPEITKHFRTQQHGWATRKRKLSPNGGNMVVKFIERVIRQPAPGLTYHSRRYIMMRGSSEMLPEAQDRVRVKNSMLLEDALHSVEITLQE